MYVTKVTKLISSNFVACTEIKFAENVDDSANVSAERPEDRSARHMDECLLPHMLDAVRDHHLVLLLRRRGVSGTGFGKQFVQGTMQICPSRNRL